MENPLRTLFSMWAKRVQNTSGCLTMWLTFSSFWENSAHQSLGDVLVSVHCPQRTVGISLDATSIPTKLRRMHLPLSLGAQWIYSWSLPSHVVEVNFDKGRVGMKRDSRPQTLVGIFFFSKVHRTWDLVKMLLVTLSGPWVGIMQVRELEA